MRSSVSFVLASSSVKLLAGLGSLLPRVESGFVGLPRSALPALTSVTIPRPDNNHKNKRFMSTSTDDAPKEVKVGDSLPLHVKLQEIVTAGERPVEVELKDLIEGKKVAIFGVPGAFTPGCSQSHLPSFMNAQEELKLKGVEATICVATNDAFVMEAWGRTSGGSDAGIRFVSDFSGDLTKALGLTMEGAVMMRTKRFSLIADNGVVTHYFSSAEQASDTWAPNVLSAL